ncbi:phage BR0599 family protein [Moraxella sp. K1664]|uniref:Bacteriophage phiJL001 Gp84 C-terminal domain-containing protein n=1 Tax=Moraxella lacunata TaxID=477 RepID=A0A1B8Q502_MORLA|nr:phage BR0599 family protein [Moraxella lacunata]MBE9577842.1 phage BR0599 family protein [Moraxella sp. K1664]MDH9218124.1 phage BR0599 family protein [Moraxella lacunata]OBX64397.1 hypothetical protein A9Z63_03285 [Moraxella lacunata]OBX64693.1 hypothetical protein A9309_04085 [Moraxella lacunata]
MSFADFETSLQNAQPIRLYQFSRGAWRWGYTSADRDVRFQNMNFVSLLGGIKDDGIRQTQDSGGDLLTLTVPSSCDLAQMYRHFAPAQTVNLTIFDLHYPELASTEQGAYLAVWKGFVVGVKFVGDHTAQVQCQNLSVSLERTGLRKTWSKLCCHQLYGKGCNLDRQAFMSEMTVVAVDSSFVDVVLPSDKSSDDYFTGGYVQWSSEYGIEQRGIERQLGNRLQLFGGVQGLTVGQNIKVFAGCNRTFTACQSKFNNTDNYGGSPHMPHKSPFDGTPIF